MNIITKNKFCSIIAVKILKYELCFKNLETVTVASLDTIAHPPKYIGNTPAWKRRRRTILFWFENNFLNC